MKFRSFIKKIFKIKSYGTIEWCMLALIVVTAVAYVYSLLAGEDEFRLVVKEVLYGLMDAFADVGSTCLPDA